MKAALRKQGWRPTEVHPVAALFPMMSDDELADLAADIKANGLNYPIVVDDDGVLIDGRNRLEACKLAGVEPHYEGLNGRKPEALIVSANLARRNLTKGQQAMALAMIYPEPAKLKRKGGSSVSEDQGVSVTRLSNARAVLRHSRALAEEVLRGGGKSLDAALVKMAEEQAETASAETQMRELREHAPDLADLVEEDRLTLSEAHSAMKQRLAEATAARANQLEGMIRASVEAWNEITGWASPEFVDDLRAELASNREFRREWLLRVRLDPERFSDITSGAKALLSLFTTITREEKL